MRRSFPLCLALSLALAAPCAAKPAAGVAAAARDSLQTAVDRGDARAVLAARAAFEARAAADPRSAEARLWVALADWRALPLVWDADPAQAKRLTQDGLRRADEALGLDAKLAEAYAIKGALEGMAIGLDAAQTMTLGPDIAVNLDRARQLAPADPRVWLLDGINLLNTPTEFGGGPRAALRCLDKAQTLFAADSTGAGWGRDDAHVWAGRAHGALGQHAEALAEYRLALAANPANAWVARTLLPAAERRAAAADSSK